MSVINCNIYRCSLMMNFVRRQVHLGPVRGKNLTAQKQGRCLAKLMSGSRRRKKNWFHEESTAKSLVAPSNKNFTSGNQSKRRVDVLNKLFMRNITDLLATGEVPSLLGLGLTITRVRVASDFSTVNVYWSSKQTIHDEKLDQILVDAGFELRHQLCQLHVMGIVPRICFVADKWHVINEQTLQYLDKAKSQDGYESEDVAEKLKSKYVLCQPVDPEILDKIKNLEAELDPLPPMTHNVLGLDHAAIMTKIKAAVKKSEAIHRHITTNDDDSLSFLPSSVGDLKSNQGIDPSYISQYIAKKKIEKKKAQQAIQKELLAVSELKSHFPEEDYVDLEDGDFIDDFEDMMKKN